MVLQVRPLLGRTFTEEEQHGDARVAVLSYAFWKRRFGGDPAICGRKIQLNGEPFEVIGVMPPEYRYPSADFELWTPLYIPPDEIRHGMNSQYIALGRLKVRRHAWNRRSPNSPAMMRRLSAEYPDKYREQATSCGRRAWSSPWRRAMPSRCAALYRCCSARSDAFC